LAGEGPENTKEKKVPMLSGCEGNIKRVKPKAACFMEVRPCA